MVWGAQETEKNKIRPDWFKILNQGEEQKKTNSYYSVEEHEKSNTESDIPKLDYKYIWAKGNSSEEENKYEWSGSESDMSKLDNRYT